MWMQLARSRAAGLKSIQSDDQDFLRDLFERVGALAHRLGLDEHGYRLVANGGRYQDFPQLHFHLVWDNPAHSP